MLFAHSGDIGDLIAHLPIMRIFGGGHLELFPAAHTGNRMTLERAESLKDWFELQTFIKSVTWTPKRSGGALNLDGWRDNCRVHANLSDIAQIWLNIAQEDRWPHDKPWMQVDHPVHVARVVIGRTERWREKTNSFSWYGVIQKYHEDAVFVGTKEEHEKFIHELKNLGRGEVARIPYYPTKNYLDLARLVAGADLVVSNQTALLWVAESLKKRVVVEVGTGDNCRFKRPDATYIKHYSEFIPTLGPPAELPSNVPEPARTCEAVIRFDPTPFIETAKQHSMLTPDRLHVIANMCGVVEHLDGVTAELGVAGGGSSYLIHTLLPRKYHFCFDTFEGIPKDDVFTEGHKKGEFAVPLEHVKDVIGDSDKVYYMQGFFPATTETLDPTAEYCLVHVDCDIYESVKAAIEYFVPRMVPGGIIVFDDYGWHRCPGVKRAIQEARLDVRQLTDNQCCFYKGP